MEKLNYDIVVVGGGLLGPLGDDVAEGDQLALVRQLGQGGHVLVVGDAAAADETDFQLFHGKTSKIVIVPGFRRIDCAIY